MAFATALYYPWIDVIDERWLRSACLYWDGIRTIVPSRIEHPYQNDISRRLADEGVLTPLFVESRHEDIEELAEDVIAYLATSEARDLLLHRSPHQRWLHVDKLPQSIRELAHVHVEKLPYEIARRLERLGQVHDGWAQVDEEFAQYYMTLLATKLAETHGLGLLTSSTAADRLAGVARTGNRPLQTFMDEERHLHRPARRHRHWESREFVEAALVDLITDGINIDPATPIEQIIRFRNAHAAELGRFRVAVGRLVSEVPQDRPLEATRQHLHDLLSNEVRPAVADLKAALAGSQLRVFTDSLLKVSFLSAAPTSALVLAGFLAPTALHVAAGISVTASAIMCSVEKQHLLRQNAYSYLLAAQRELGRY